MAQWRETRIAASGVGLNVRHAGSGPTVLLLHGFPDSRRLWSEVGSQLVAQGYRVIAPDLRGFGKSDAPQAQRHYSLGHIVADLRALVMRLCGGGPLHVVGHDWGAVAGWCLAVEHPQAVASLVALSVGHPAEYARAGLAQKLKGLYTVAWQFPGLSERWLARGNFSGLRGWARQHPDIDSCIDDMARPGRLTAGLNWYRANLRSMLLPHWGPCSVPTLGVWSDGDHFLAEDQMRASGRRVRDAAWRYECVRGAGHWLPLERPELVTALAVEWARAHPAGVTA